jgi:hypothetical protein
MMFSQQRARTRQPFGRSGILLTVSLSATLFVSSPVYAQKQEPDNCKWKSTAVDRAKVKNRALKTDRYPKHNNGETITIPEFYDLVCSFNAPAKKDIEPDTPIPDFEEKTVTVHGFLLAAKFERGEDHDIHAQIATSKEWNQDQLIIEVPAGGKYCPVRKVLWSLVRKDRETSGSHSNADSIKFTDPPEVTVTGYLFLDAHHITKKTTPAKYCIANGGRGLQKNGKNSVRGIWELHPTIALAAVQ